MAVTLRWKRRTEPLAATKCGRTSDRLGWSIRAAGIYRQLRMQLTASWVNKRWISTSELDEIRRGN